MGVFLGASTRIIDRTSGETFRGEVPPYSVVVPGTVETGGAAGQKLALSAAIIVKRVDERTRAKTSINELLRD
jgi:2,3,4,5-tetrahydropyridine-2-carboxylate N-succinyltransferase